MYKLPPRWVVLLKIYNWFYGVIFKTHSERSTKHDSHLLRCGNEHENLRCADIPTRTLRIQNAWTTRHVVNRPPRRARHRPRTHTKTTSSQKKKNYSHRTAVIMPLGAWFMSPNRDAALFSTAPRLMRKQSIHVCSLTFSREYHFTVNCLEAPNVVRFIGNMRITSILEVHTVFFCRISPLREIANSVFAQPFLCMLIEHRIAPRARSITRTPQTATAQTTATSSDFANFDNAMRHKRASLGYNAQKNQLTSLYLCIFLWSVRI